MQESEVLLIGETATPRMPISQSQSDTKKCQEEMTVHQLCHVPLFPEIPGTMLLHYQASKVPRCPNLWRAGVSYLPCLRTRDATGIVLLTGTDTCLENFDIKCFSPG